MEDNTVSFQDKSIELTKNEAKILRLLLERKNSIVSRDDLMEYLWKTDYYVDEKRNYFVPKKNLSDVMTVL